jgi:alkaline phosphatase
VKRRDFINTGLLTAFTGTVATSALLSGCRSENKGVKGKARNIIFLVSDGMSSGTLNMADLLLQRKEGRGSTWMDLYRQNRGSRALMDTASADSLVTDSAAASSAWGGGTRINNGKLNVNADGSFNKPVLQKFKEAGKSVGCVTTVPVTHATPAGFCVNMKHRNMQDKIASEYLELKFDVMMGGGLEYFDGSKREDKRNIFGDFVSGGFQVVKTRSEMEKTIPGKPVIGVFCEDGLPYDLDMQNDPDLKAKISTLTEMTQKAIDLMSRNSNGFVLQVEGGKVDWAAHANDTSALIYDQIEFDRAAGAAVKFAESRDDTLVVITTDHGNANPGLIKSDKVDEMFDTLQTVKHTNDWVLNGISGDDTLSDVIERLHFAQGITITKEEAKFISDAYKRIDGPGLYNPYKLPFQKLAEIQQNYTSVYWSGMNHSADFVELAMFGAGSEALPPFVKNTDLHNYMLMVTGVEEFAVTV